MSHVPRLAQRYSEFVNSKLKAADQEHSTVSEVLSEIWSDPLFLIKKMAASLKSHDSVCQSAADLVAYAPLSPTLP